MNKIRDLSVVQLLNVEQLWMKKLEGQAAVYNNLLKWGGQWREKYVDKQMLGFASKSPTDHHTLLG